MSRRGLPLSIAHMRIGEKFSPYWNVSLDRSRRVVFFNSSCSPLGIPGVDPKKHLFLSWLHWLLPVREPVPAVSSLPPSDSARRPTALEATLSVQDVSTPAGSE